MNDVSSVRATALRFATPGDADGHETLTGWGVNVAVPGHSTPDQITIEPRDRHVPNTGAEDTSMIRTPFQSLAAWALAIVCSLLLTAIAFGLETARMKLPVEFREVADVLPATGYGGWNRGRYELGEFAGDFTRTESRFAAFDPLFAANYGKSSVTLERPGIEGAIRAECSFKENVVTVGVITFAAKKLVYVCDITDDAGKPIGRTALGQPKPKNFKERVLAAATRKGQTALNSISIDIDSIHHYEGSKFSSPTPTGYLLSHEGQAIGAIELTDFNPTFYLRRDVEPDVRLATLVAALTLSVLRDPAESALSG